VLTLPLIEKSSRPGTCASSPAAGSLADSSSKGCEHERNCLQELEDDGRSVYQVPGRNPDETFLAWVERIGNPMQDGHDVIYQMPSSMRHSRHPDFLIRKEGVEGYSRMNRSTPSNANRRKTGHVLQLCFYGRRPRGLDGRVPSEASVARLRFSESLRVEEFRPYWRRLRRQLPHC